jgi:hypothetical protein
MMAMKPGAPMGKILIGVGIAGLAGLALVALRKKGA